MQEREREGERGPDRGGRDKGNLFPASRGVTAHIVIGQHLASIFKQTNKQTPLDGPVEEKQPVSLSVKNWCKLAFNIEVSKQSNAAAGRKIQRHL